MSVQNRLINVRSSYFQSISLTTRCVFVPSDKVKRRTTKSSTLYLIIIVVGFVPHGKIRGLDVSLALKRGFYTKTVYIGTCCLVGQRV